jgi:hypothetical protein
MKLRLERRFFGEEYTISDLMVNGDKLCEVIEDKVRDLNEDGDLNDPGEGKVFGETAIPYGTYEIDLTMSPKFQRLLPILIDVPHFTGIRIHRGNTAKDTHGCLLPGENKAKGQVLNSTIYEMDIVSAIYQAKLRGEKVTIDVIRKRKKA